MLVHALFDPGVFLISDELWNCETSRTEFLDRLDKHLEFLDLLGIGKILWSDELDERLWSEPYLSPWKESRGWGIGLTQILYFKLSKHSKKLDISQQIPGETRPSLQFNCSYTKDIFHKLVSAVLNIALTPHFCPGIQNTCCQDLVFLSHTSTQWSHFPVVGNPVDWPKKIDPILLFWPTSRADTKKFDKCIKLVAMAKNIDPARLQRFTFSPCFISDLVDASRKERVVEMIVHRLSLTLQEAARDPQLQDEVLASGVRRFRVTPRPSSLRIHYDINDNGITFNRFYDEGHHDEGL